MKRVGVPILLVIILVLFCLACSSQRRPVSAKAANATVARVFFSFNSADVPVDQERTIRQQAEVLRKSENRVIQLEGFTDSIGMSEYNLMLGDRRARAVQEIIVMEGINPRQLIILSFGEERPLESNTTEAGRAKNRRVEMKVR